MLQLPRMSSLLMCHLLLSLRMCHLLLLLSPPLRSSLSDVVTTFVGHLTVTLLQLSQSLLCLSQLLIVMLFFIWNGNMRWPRRLLLLSGLAREILCLVPYVFVRSLVSRSIRLRLTLIVLLSVIRLVSLLVVFSISKVMIMMRLLLMLLI
jgi:hypothetical protein